MKYISKKAAILAVLTVLFASTPRASEQLTITGSVAFEDGAPVAGGTVRITDMRKRFLGRFRLPKSVLLATVVTSADGSFRAEVSGVKGYLDIRLTYATCKWTGGLETVPADETSGAESIQVDLITKPSVACDEE